MERARRIAVATGRVLVALVSISVLVATAYGWSVYRGISTRIVTSDVLPETASPGLDEPLTALLVGLDSRTDAAGNPLPPELLDQLRAGADEGQLHTDTIILLHVPAGPRAAATAISIPRDSYVPIAGGRGKHKINSAYWRGIATPREELAAQGVTGAELDRAGHRGGPDARWWPPCRTLTGVTVDHYAEINLAGFVEITEALGGRAGLPQRAGARAAAPASTCPRGRRRSAAPTRWRSSGSGTASTAATSTGSPASRRSSPGSRAPSCRRGTLADPARLDRLVGALTRYVVLDRGWDLDRLVEQFRRATAATSPSAPSPPARPTCAHPSTASRWRSTRSRCGSSSPPWSARATRRR